MAWDSNRRIKIIVPGKQKNIGAEFEVEEAKREQFRTDLEYFLAACVNAGGTIGEFKETLDGETGKPAALEIIVRGHQETMSNELVKASSTLKIHSVRSR